MVLRATGRRPVGLRRRASIRSLCGVVRRLTTRPLYTILLALAATACWLVAFSLRKWAPASLPITVGIYLGALVGTFIFSYRLADQLRNDDFMTWLALLGIALLVAGPLFPLPLRWEPFPTDLGNLGFRVLLTWALGLAALGGSMYLAADQRQAVAVCRQAYAAAQTPEAKAIVDTLVPVHGFHPGRHGPPYRCGQLRRRGML